VTNTGKVAGDEVVQLYIHDEAASVTRPLLELKHFKRVTLAPGAKTDRDLRGLAAGPVAVEPGDEARGRAGQVHPAAGPNSVDLKKATLTVV
jgi:beta-glucosidase